jgi:hypothetical protein
MIGVLDTCGHDQSPCEAANAANVRQRPIGKTNDDRDPRGNSATAGA